MIYRVRHSRPCACKQQSAAPCACHGKPRALGDATGLQCDQDGNCYQDGVLVDKPAAPAPALSWEWIAIAALAGLAVFQAINQPAGRNRR